MSLQNYSENQKILKSSQVGWQIIGGIYLDEKKEHFFLTSSISETVIADKTLNG